MPTQSGDGVPNPQAAASHSHLPVLVSHMGAESGGAGDASPVDK